MTAAVVGCRLGKHDHSALVMLNPFSINIPLLNSLKTENQRFSDDFKGYRSGTLVENGIKWLI